MDSFSGSYEKCSATTSDVLFFIQKKEIAKLKDIKEAGQKVALSGDGQFDSPGLSNSSHGIIYEFWFKHSMRTVTLHFSENIFATMSRCGKRQNIPNCGNLYSGNSQTSIRYPALNQA